MMETDNLSSVVIRTKHPVLDVASVARSKLISFEEYLRNIPITDIYFLKKFLGYSYKECLPPIIKEDIEALINFNKAYELYKTSLGVIDYTSILEKALEQDKSIPDYEVVFVDEAQDLSKLQWKVVEKVFNKSQNIYIAGDDDQAICESFGASVETFINYKCDKEIILKQSYRVPSVVHNKLFGADNIIDILSKAFSNRKEKNWKPKVDSYEGSFVKIKKHPFINLIKKYQNKDWLIMAATHETLNKFSDLLKNFQISHILRNKVITLNDEDKKLPSIEIKTIWGAKGAEADCTALIRENTFNEEKMIKNDPRLVYVAQTRTKCLHFEVSDLYFSDIINLDFQFLNLPEVNRDRKGFEDKINEKKLTELKLNINQHIDSFYKNLMKENKLEISSQYTNSLILAKSYELALIKIKNEEGIYGLNKENLRTYFINKMEQVENSEIRKDKNLGNFFHTLKIVEAALKKIEDTPYKHINK